MDEDMISSSSEKTLGNMLGSDANLHENNSEYRQDESELKKHEEIVRFYNLFFRRDPENSQVVEEKYGCTLDDLLDIFLGSEEFFGVITRISTEKDLKSLPYHGETSFNQLMGWASEVLSVFFDEDTIDKLTHAIDWEDADLALIQDSAVAKRIALLSDPAVVRGFELRALWARLEQAWSGGMHESAELLAEGGKVTAAALSDGSLYVALGDILRERGKRQEAIRVYRLSLTLEPSLAAISALRALDAPVDITGLPAPKRRPEIFFEITDLFGDLVGNITISGIQRIQLSIIAYVLAEHEAGRALDCHLVWWVDDELCKFDPDLLLEVLQIYQQTEVRDAAYRRKVVTSLREKGEVVLPVPGDVLLSTGVIYNQQNLVLNNARLKRLGVRLGAYIHDFIPLTHPEFCDSGLTEVFSKTMSVALLQYDFALTVSGHVEREMRRLMAQSNYPEIPIQTVLEAHATFGQLEGADDGWGPDIVDLAGTDFVLCVGTFSAHKNQALIIQIWQMLIREGLEPPTLVLVGRRGHNVNDLMSLLATTRNLEGRVKVLEGLKDSELHTLYRNCLFTIQPSHVEGWGLPVGESLTRGKVCVASNAASIPEVGGDFSLYIDPNDLFGAANVVRGLILDRAELQRLSQRIQTEFKPRTWQEHVTSLIDAVRTLGGSGATHWIGAKPVTVPFRQAIGLSDVETGWQYGTAFPPADVAAERVLRRTLLEKNWYLSESWGAWMKGGQGHIGFTIESQVEARVRVVLQLRAAWWAIASQLLVKSRCGASVTTRLPDPHGPRDFLLQLDCMADEAGRVELTVEVLGGLPETWWGEKRQFCVGLMRIACFEEKDIEAPVPSNRRLSPTTKYRSFGTSSLIRAMRGKAILMNGWYEPRPGAIQMLGCMARIVLRTDGKPGETARIALRLRAKPGHSGEIIAKADSGFEARLNLLGSDPRDFTLWIDGQVDERKNVGLILKLQAISPGLDELGKVFPLTMLAAAYTRLESGEQISRSELAEILQFPDGREEEASFREAYGHDMHVSVAGHINGSYSLAATNRRLALALERTRAGTVRVDQVEGGRFVRDLSRLPASERMPIAELARREWHREGPHVQIIQHWPVLENPRQTDLTLAWVAWEENLVPENMVKMINRSYNGVLVQTRFVAKALIDSGVYIPVRLMGYSPDLSKYAAVGDEKAASDPRAKPSKNAPFTFLHVSSCFPRKGVDALLAAYVATFRNTDNVRLVIKGFANEHNDVPKQIEVLRKSDPELPEIVLINRDLPEMELVDLYRQADAVVLPTRGEGFNLPAAEALASATPLIVTKHSGHVDFATSDVARLVDFKFAPSQSHVASEGSVWADPDVADLGKAMFELFAAVRSAKARSKIAARTERGRQVATALGDGDAWAGRIKEIAVDLLCDSRSDRANPPTVAWVTSWNVACGIATYSDYLLSRYPDAARDVIVLCDERTPHDRLVTPGRPPARIAWRLDDATSSVRIALAIAEIGAQAVVIQHQRGLIKTDVLTALLLDERLAGREVIVALHNPRELVVYEGWQELRSALQRTSRVIVHDVTDLNLLKTWGLVDNVMLLPHGALHGAIDRRPARDLPASSAPVIGTYGFAFPDKGVTVLIEALARLRQEWPDARLRMVTAEHPSSESAAEIARCRTLADSLGVGGAIDWHTQYLSDGESLALLNGCDLLVLPRRETPESASGAVRIAMASRVPVLVTPVKIFEGLGDAVLRTNGLDATSIVTGIAAALRDRALRDKIVNRADRQLEGQDWKRLSQRLQGMIQGLVVNPQFEQERVTALDEAAIGLTP